MAAAVAGARAAAGVEYQPLSHRHAEAHPLSSATKIPLGESWRREQGEQTTFFFSLALGAAARA